MTFFREFAVNALAGLFVGAIACLVGWMKNLRDNRVPRGKSNRKKRGRRR